MEHNKTGLKYFGKTRVHHTIKDLKKYGGSGKYWKRHLKKHGKDISVSIFYQTKNLELASSLALMYSRFWNITESKDYANLKPENAKDGFASDEDNPSKKPENRKRLSEINKGFLYIKVNGKRITSKEYRENYDYYSNFHKTKGLVLCIVNNEIKTVIKEEFYNNNYDTPTTNYVTAIDTRTNETFSINKEDFINNPYLVGINKGKISNKNNPNAKRFMVYEDFNMLLDNFGSIKDISKRFKIPYLSLKKSYDNHGEYIKGTNMFMVKIPEKQIRKLENGEDLTKKECLEVINFYRYDFVTGLKGRQDFFYTLNEMFNNAENFYLYLLDVKNLKKKNEISYFEGDKLLKLVADKIKKYPGDYFRFRGGDEFAIISYEDFDINIEEVHWAKVYSKDYKSSMEMFKDCDQKLIEAKKEYYKQTGKDRRN
jgi:GGDEF domain-containing protein